MYDFISKRHVLLLGALALLAQGVPQSVSAAPVPGGTLDPMTIPKYVIPLVIPPEMPKSTTQPGTPAADYNIAVRQFKQQILPGGIWNHVTGRTDLPFGPTTVWSYGRAQDPLPDSSSIPGGAAGVAPALNSTFNYPALTVEATSGALTKVRWINDLVNPATGNYLPHLLPIDQTLHWANPGKGQCTDGTFRTDCRTSNPAPYTGPVPMVVHVHGAHVNPESDGYASAWWLPNANNIPAGYAKRGVDYDQYNIANAVPGSAYFAYENDQPASTIWYHDHALGMTRSNVYAGPAGFWLIRGGAFGDNTLIDNSTGLTAQLPGPAARGTADPNFNATTRESIREIPLAIQDRSFNFDPATNATSLFYPSAREFFDGFMGPYVPTSDISPIWNPEAFFNTMVVNGTTWPQLEVAQAKYRFRLLNGCNSRTINLSLRVVDGAGTDNVMGTADDVLGAEIPFYQIGAEQGFLPNVVMISTGFATLLPGNGTIPDPTPIDPDKALLLGNAERADVIVDFGALPLNTVVRLINTAPDAPFGGFPDTPADPDTTGQVMQFVVNRGPLPGDANTTSPQDLILNSEPALAATTKIRKLSLNEEESAQVCVRVNPDESVDTLFTDTSPQADFMARCEAAGGVPAAPKEALLGIVMTDSSGTRSMPMMWGDLISERPILNDVEEWEIYNLTVDAHPIHLHLVGFQVVNRQALLVNSAGNSIPEIDPSAPAILPELNELGYKDTALMYPGMVTRIRAKFDRVGTYVWHCHIVEHEDNEMMRPYTVRYDPDCPDFNNSNTVTTADLSILMAEMRSPRKAKKLAYDLNGDGKLNLLDARFLQGKLGMTCP